MQNTYTLSAGSGGPITYTVPGTGIAVNTITSTNGLVLARGSIIEPVTLAWDTSPQVTLREVIDGKTICAKLVPEADITAIESMKICTMLLTFKNNSTAKTISYLRDNNLVRHFSFWEE